MIKFTHRGSFTATENFLNKAKKKDFTAILDKYGQQGVAALASATPVDTGLTADKWGYEISTRRHGFSIHWTNTNINDGIPVVILLQYGHGTRSGSFVQGRDFINPSIRPVFDAISENIWKEVTSL